MSRKCRPKPKPSIAGSHFRGVPGKGGTVTLRIDDVIVAQGRVERTVRAIFSMNEQLDIGVDRGSPVTEEIARRGRSSFTGTLRDLRIDLSRGGGVPEAERRKVEMATH